MLIIFEKAEYLCLRLQEDMVVDGLYIGAYPDKIEKAKVLYVDVCLQVSSILAKLVDVMVYKIPSI